MSELSYDIDPDGAQHLYDSLVAAGATAQDSDNVTREPRPFGTESRDRGYSDDLIISGLGDLGIVSSQINAYKRTGHIISGEHATFSWVTDTGATSVMLSPQGGRINLITDTSEPVWVQSIHDPAIQVAMLRKAMHLLGTLGAREIVRY